LLGDTSCTDSEGQSRKVAQQVLGQLHRVQHVVKPGISPAQAARTIHCTWRACSLFLIIY
jgi:hypothetical protein